MSTEVAKQDDQPQGGAVMKRIPVPKQLQELGVIIADDADSGMQIVVVPAEVRRKVNVIHPVTSFVQSNPHWTPSISLVQLDKELHTYNVSGKLGLNKQALETLAQAGGIIETTTRRLKADELGPGERWGYEATVKIRRGDGQVVPRSASRTFNEEAERAEIEESVRSAKIYQSEALKFDTPEKIAAEVQKRWLNELRFGPAKTESKAINRAIRAALQVPTSMKAADFAKPFLVIGYSFTPDYNDIEIRRMLVAAGLNQGSAVYGGSAVAALEQGADDEPLPAMPEEAGEGVGDAEAAEVAVDAPSERQQAASDETSNEAVASEAVPGDAEPEPGPRDEEPVEEVEAELVEPVAPADYVVTKGSWKGKTVAEVAAAPGGDEWIKWSLKQGDEKQTPGQGDAVRGYVLEHLPEVWEEYELSAQAE